MPRGLYFLKAFFEGLIFGGAYLRREICVAKSIWTSLIVRGKLTVFALFYFVFKSNFQLQAPGGAYIWRGDLTEVFLRYEFGGLIFRGAYTWRGLFSEFYGVYSLRSSWRDCCARRNLILGGGALKTSVEASRLCSQSFTRLCTRSLIPPTTQAKSISSTSSTY